jgi:acyl-CoA thioester hydrolase
MIYLERIGWMELAARTGVGPILHSTAARYRSPVTYPDTVHVGVRARELGADRFLTEYRVWSSAQRVVVAEGSGTVVAFDYHERRKTALPEAVRQAILGLDPEAAAG